MTTDRMYASIDVIKAKLVLSLIAAFALSGCGFFFQRGSVKIAPDDKISVEGLTAKIEHREYCWDGCKQTDRITFFRGYKKLGEEFFSKEIGMPYQPHTEGLIAFPRKAMFITTFSSSNDGEIAAGLTVVDNQPRIQPLMGCLDGDEPVSNHPTNGNRICANHPNNLSYWPALYLQETKISYHSNFWIDYETETFHEIARQFPTEAELIGVIGIDQPRSHLVLLFGTTKNETYLLCAYGNRGFDATYRCIEFIAAEPAPLTKDREGTSPAKLPVQTSGIRFANVDTQLVEARLAWLSRYFSSPLSLVTKASTHVVSTKNGIKPSPFETSPTRCGQCTSNAKPLLIDGMLSPNPQGQSGSDPVGSDPL